MALLCSHCAREKTPAPAPLEKNPRRRATLLLFKGKKASPAPKQIQKKK
jgi:hypothetical protein